MAEAVVAAAVEHFATCWQILPTSPDFALLLVNPGYYCLEAIAPVRVVLLVEVVGFAMHFVAVAKPVVVVERPAAVDVAEIFRSLQNY